MLDINQEFIGVVSTETELKKGVKISNSKFQNQKQNYI
jgi:hypothetical protein